jgi:hypothetical protein
MNDWEQRELCSDGACVGVLDDHGACKVCGTKAPDWQPRAGAAEARDESDADDVAEDAADAPAPAASAAPGAPAMFEIDGDPDDRKLCPDGACVGLIGDNGTCKVCGAEAA